MNQVSRPMQIALAAVLVVALAWFVALRPKDDSTAPATPAATPAQNGSSSSSNGTSLLSRPEKAREAVNSANQTNQANADKATGDPTAAPAPDAAGTKAAADRIAAQKAAEKAAAQRAAAAKKAAAARATAAEKAAAAKRAAAKKAAAAKAASVDLSNPIIAAAKRGDVQVVLFYSPTGTDDAFVRTQLAAINRLGGKVDVHSVKISRVGRYRAIADAAKVDSAPTLVVLNKKLDVSTITGYTDTREIDGLVGAIARRN